jgi:DNA (cytosine-5)-methyltransferase 1
LTTKDKISLVTVKRFLLNPQYNSKGSSIDKPCFTLIARMDKMPPSLSYELDMVRSDGTFISCTHYRRENEIFKTKKELLKSL